MMSAGSKATYVFHVEGHQDKRKRFDFEKLRGKTHKELIEDKKQIIQGIVTALRQGGTTTIEITAKDGEEMSPIWWGEEVEANTTFHVQFTFEENPSQDTDYLIWPPTTPTATNAEVPAHPAQVSAKSTFVFGGATAGKGAVATNKNKADVQCGKEPLDLTSEGAIAKGEGAEAITEQDLKLSHSTVSSDGPDGGSIPQNAKDEGIVYVKPDGWPEGQVYTNYEFKKNVGKVLIINNYKFTSPQSGKKHTRKGSKEDGDRLVELFEKTLKFKKSDHQEKIQLVNKTKDQIEEAVKQFAEESYTEFSCSVLVLMSHGKESQVLDVDEKEIDIPVLLNYFKRNETLHGKPKIFFFQACRGTDHAVPVESDDATAEQGGVPEVASDVIDVKCMPNSADFFVGYATSYGDRSFRYTDPHSKDYDYGSWYMLRLVEAIRKYHLGFDVAEIHSRVNHMVGTDLGAITVGGSLVEVKQAPQYVSSLRGKFFLSNRKPKQ
eukprot:m.258044 g.258044  ORF g.258044 m.258044 type:complete len:492 (+) comp40413_c2_seq9:7218-8693(+)